MRQQKYNNLRGERFYVSSRGSDGMEYSQDVRPTQHAVVHSNLNNGIYQHVQPTQHAVIHSNLNNGIEQDVRPTTQGHSFEPK